MTTSVDTRPPAATPAGAPTGDPRRGGALVGTGTLIRFVLRRDRIKLPAWLLGITVLLFYYAAALTTVYETDEQRQGLGSFMEGPVGALLSGPGYGIDDLNTERIIVGVYALYFFVLAALMNILLVSRHTRVDEQNGRTELIRASVVGRHAQLTATLIVAACANLLLTLSLGGAMAANGFDAADGFLFGAGVGATGLVFAGITALTVQVTEYSRAASGLAGLALGGSWVIRAAGDMLEQHGSLLSWFSPLAWAQQTRPFVDSRWWPLALSIVLAAAAAAGGYALSARRDLGAGLVAARRGSPVAPGWLRTPFTFALRLQRASLIGWTGALVGSGLLFGWITEPMIDAYEDMGDDMVALLGGDPSNLLDGYLSVMALFMALMVGVFVILGVQSLRFEETKGRAEPVLATGISRWAWCGSYLAVLGAGAVWLLLATGFATGVGAAISTGEAGSLWDVTAAHLVLAPAVLVLLGLAGLLFGVLPRAIGATWALLGFAMFVGFFGPLMDLPQSVANVSPLEHLPGMPLEEFRLAPVLILTAVAAALAAAGLAAFRRRDLDTK